VYLTRIQRCWTNDTTEPNGLTWRGSSFYILLESRGGSWKQAQNWCVILACWLAGEPTLVEWFCFCLWTPPRVWTWLALGCAGFILSGRWSFTGVIVGLAKLRLWSTRFLYSSFWSGSGFAPGRLWWRWWGLYHSGKLDAWWMWSHLLVSCLW